MAMGAIRRKLRVGARHADGLRNRTGRLSVSLSPQTVSVPADHRRRQIEGRLRFGPNFNDYGLVFAGTGGRFVSEGWRPR